MAVSASAHRIAAAIGRRRRTTEGRVTMRIVRTSSVFEGDLLDRAVDDEHADVVLLRVGGREEEPVTAGAVLLGEPPDLLAIAELDDRLVARDPVAEAARPLDLAPLEAEVAHVEQRLQLVEADRRRDAA